MRVVGVSIIPHAWIRLLGGPTMARTLFVHDFRLISELGPSRRQRQVRKRWIAVGVAAGVTALVAIAGSVTDRNDRASREPVTRMALMDGVAR